MCAKVFILKKFSPSSSKMLLFQGKYVEKNQEKQAREFNGKQILLRIIFQTRKISKLSTFIKLYF